MMKRYIAILILLTSIKSFSQNNETNAFNKVKLVFSKSVSCVKDSKQCSIYYNSDQKQLDINNYLVPLLKIKVEYSFNEINPKLSHYVKFECEDNCVTNPDGEIILAVSISFFSKKDCYDFIETISALKKEIRKQSN